MRKPTANIFNDEELRPFPQRSRTRQGYPLNTSACPAQYWSPSHSKKKRHPNWKEVKLHLSVDGTILYTENPKDSTEKLLELINEFNSHRIQKAMYRNMLHSYTLNNEAAESEIKKIIPITLTQETIII